MGWSLSKADGVALLLISLLKLDEIVICKLLINVGCPLFKTEYCFLLSINWHLYDVHNQQKLYSLLLLCNNNNTAEQKIL